MGEKPCAGVRFGAQIAIAQTVVHTSSMAAAPPGPCLTGSTRVDLPTGNAFQSH